MIKQEYTLPITAHFHRSLIDDWPLFRALPLEQRWSWSILKPGNEVLYHESRMNIRTMFCQLHI